MNLRCLEWVFSRGVTFMTGEKEGVDTGALADFKDFEAFYAAYCRQVDSQIDLQVSRRLENLGMSEIIAPDPLMSTMMDGCIAKGRDMTGTNILPYTFHLLLITGLSNAVDSLCAVKKLVFEDHAATLEDLKNAIENNWKGYEELRLIALNKVPKYGNDNDEADNMLARVMKDFEDSCVRWRGKQSAIKIPVGIGTFENYAALGRNLSASPDGRGSGEALAPNYSPTPGIDVNGPTAVIKSATRPDLMRYFCGCPLDISLNANEFQGEAGVTRMEGIIRSFCDLGGQIATITTTSVEELGD